MRSHAPAFVSVLLIALVLGAPGSDAGQSAKAAPAKAPTSAAKATVPLRLPDGHPNLQGIWSTATVTPFERPKEFANKEFLTEDEAARYEVTEVDRLNVDNRDDKRGTNQDVTLAYNDVWWDRGTRVVPTRRTSLIIDPPDGKMPALTAYGKERQSKMIPYSGFQDGRILGSWLDRGLWERCITRECPTSCADGLQQQLSDLQTSTTVAILAEMIRARSSRLTGAHPGPSISQWMGNSPALGRRHAGRRLDKFH